MYKKEVRLQMTKVYVYDSSEVGVQKIMDGFNDTQ